MPRQLAANFREPFCVASKLGCPVSSHPFAEESLCLQKKLQAKKVQSFHCLRAGKVPPNFSSLKGLHASLYGVNKIVLSAV